MIFAVIFMIHFLLFLQFPELSKLETEIAKVKDAAKVR